MAEGKRKKFYSEEVKKNFKTEVVKMRIKKEDKLILKEKADALEMSVTDYMHYKIFRKMDTDFKPNILVNLLADYVKKVNKVGVNIDQSTNYVNFLNRQQKVEPKAIKEYTILIRQFKALLEKQQMEIIRECRKFLK